MYDNIGGKIKGLAVAIFILGCIGGAIAGIATMGISESFIAGLPILIFVPLASWISSWFLYGFGEIIDKVSAIERNTRKQGVDYQVEATNKKIAEIERNKSRKEFLSSGLTQKSPERKICPNCGETVKSSVCEMCGKSNNLYK